MHRARGIAGDVWCVRPDQRVCRRHRRWLGGLTRPSGEQHDLTPLPEVRRAQQRHYQLLRRHGVDAGRSAIYRATAILDEWTERGDWSEHRERRLARLFVTSGHLPPGTGARRLVNYPEIVTLAGLLASEHWSSLASSRRRPDRGRFDAEVARRLQILYRARPAGEALVAWQAGEALVRRRRAHGQARDHTGLDEVWLAGPTVVDDADPGARIAAASGPVPRMDFLARQLNAWPAKVS
jgi:hypothetical protein